MMEVAPLVLLIEDEDPMRRFLRTSLAQHNYRLVEAKTGEDGVVQARTHNPDIVLLDLGLPDIDGLEVTKRLRGWTTIPIIVLSARGQEHDKVIALDAGADDYLTKPFGTGELLARIRVALRHHARVDKEHPATSLTIGDVHIDFERRLVLVRDAEVHLTPIEYKLAAVLMRNAGKVVTHRQLLHEVWGPTHTNETQYLRVYMSQLRHKLERDPARPTYLVNEPGVGYRLRITER
jgi:two-component system KDP operon response regulator KdpE